MKKKKYPINILSRASILEQGCQFLENREKSGKFGGQGKVRKFCLKSGNFIKNLIFLENDATKRAHILFGAALIIEILKAFGTG